MIETLKKWQEQIDARIIRERVLILCTLLAMLFMLWNIAVQNGIDKTKKDRQAQLAALVQQQSALKTQIAATIQGLSNDPDKQKKAQITQLESDLTALDVRLQSASNQLIKAELLPKSLQDVLQKTEQLTLTQVNTLPAEELKLKLPASGGDSTTGVFQHAVEIKISGSYGQLVQFLVRLEQLPWRFYWQDLEYSVTSYPNAEIRLRVYTLSSEEGAYGV